MTKEEVFTLLDIAQGVRQTWPQGKEARRLWLCGYRVALVPRAQWPEEAHLVDLGEVCALVMAGRLTWIQPEYIVRVVSRDEVEGASGGKESSRTPRKVASQPTPPESPGKEGLYLILVSPLDPDRWPNEQEAHDHIVVAKALIRALSGPNMVSEELFNQGIDVDRRQGFGYSAWLHSRCTFQVPDVSVAGLRELRRASETISALPDVVRERTVLSLRWYESAAQDLGPLAFLKYWIALETLVGQEREKAVSAISRGLSQSYPEETDPRQTFGIGLIYGIRKLIVHGGRLIRPDGLILIYMGELYLDLLFDRLSLPYQHRAARLKDEATGLLEEMRREMGETR